MAVLLFSVAPAYRFMGILVTNVGCCTYLAEGRYSTHTQLIGYCGDNLTGNGATGAVVASSNCQTSCAGDSSQKCGGNWFLNVFKTSTSGSTATATATTSSTKTFTSTSTTPSATATTWNTYGCVLEGTTGSRRSLTGASFTSTSMTPAKCQGLCAGYLYAGTEYG